MAKTGGQKAKLLYILQILKEQSDEENPITMHRILESLGALEIPSERKSVYRDIELLKDCGYQIEFKKTGLGGGYYLKNREFELAELKLLVDAVQASRFITVGKSRELIGKLEKFAGKEGARQLKRQVYVSNRIKTDNESIYHNVDSIHRAMQEGVQITFAYLEWDILGKLRPRKGGKIYQASPWGLLWNDENYYMVAYDKEAEKIKHYRVDKMGSIGLTEVLREGKELMKDFDPASYSNKTFGMYGGREETVSLVFENYLVGVVMDRFGRETSLRKTDEEHFSIRIKVAVSGQFFGWLTGLGDGARLSGPKEVVAEYKEYLQKIEKQY